MLNKHVLFARLVKSDVMEINLVDLAAGAPSPVDTREAHLMLLSR
jgi:hypothetical protein